MEKKYRELFDEVHASERLRTEVMDMTQEKHPRRLRAALAAALVAVALTGTVLAAGAATGFDIVRFFNGEKRETLPDENGEEREYGVIYEIGREGMTYFPEADMSEEYRTVVREGTYDGALPYAGSGLYLTKPSWKAAEEFLGLELANSQVLEERGRLASFGVMFEGMSHTEKVNVLLHISRNGQNSVKAFFIAPKSDADASVDLNTLSLYICILTDAVAPDMRDNSSWFEVVQNLDLPHDGSENAREDYVTAGGLEATIIKRKIAGAEDFTRFDGIFVLNGMGYRLTSNNEAFLKEVLDGFQ